MTRVLWHSHSPLAATGYGTPTALWLPVLRDLGYEVTASAFTGQSMDFTLGGIEVINTAENEFTGRPLADLAARIKPDILITLMDIWVYPPHVIDQTGIPAVNWIPVDTTPLSVLDERYFRQSTAFPVAMSEYGARTLEAAGIDAAAIPYAFNPAVFRPDQADRDTARREAGLDGKFTVGINAANVERKAWPEQLSGYARLWREHPGEVVLLARTSREGAVDLAAVVRALGLPPEAIRWGFCGDLNGPSLASWYRTLDVLCSATCAEGFCMPVAEAQACNTPVIVTDAPPVSEEAGRHGRKVPCEPAWHQGHQAWWHRPSVTGIHQALEDALAAERGDVTGHVEQYKIGNVAPLWAALIEKRT